MFKKILLLVIAVAAFLHFCGEEEETPVYTQPEELLEIQGYIEGLSEDQLPLLRLQTALLLHPLQDAIDLFGENYTLLQEDGYGTIVYPQVAFSVWLGADFAQQTWENPMEYLRHGVIQRVVMDRVGTPLLEDITIGMTAGEIARQLGADGLAYRSDSTLRTGEYDREGNRIQVYEVYGQVGQVAYTLVFKDHVLTRLELVSCAEGLPQTHGDRGAAQLERVFAYLKEAGQADFSPASLRYRYASYDAHYGSWFDCWQFVDGSYEGCEIWVERQAPYRICARAAGGMPLVFWCDGNYVNPALSFLGTWRGYNGAHYLQIKSISQEGILLFDMYTSTGQGEEMVLLENLSTALEELPQTLDDYLMYQYYGMTVAGEMQLFDGTVQSGCYRYAGDIMYLMDCLVLDLSGSVRYLPTGMGGRIGTGTLTVHIPQENPDYSQSAGFGYMENFGRDDPNPENIMSTTRAAGLELLNRYLNGVYNTTDLQYAHLDYEYLYDYRFPVSGVIYHVWQSRDSRDAHYLYVDPAGGMILQEKAGGSRHVKSLIYKDGVRVASRSYAQQAFVSLDGKLRVDLEGWQITHRDAFVPSLEISEMGMDTVGENERFMFFITVGDRFAVNGYVLFDHTTWGATLHITDSNMPGLPIGLHYLISETFFLDPSVGVVAVPEEDEDRVIEEAMPETGQQIRLEIRDYGGRIIGYIHVDADGDKTVRTYSGKILGYYHADRDVTTDYSGRVLARGDIASALLFMEQ